MTHLALPWWPRTTSSVGGDSNSSIESGSSSSSSNGVASVNNGCGLSSLMKRLKKKKKYNKSSSFQCRYDPLSYSLNFDSSGGDQFVDDEEYYKFYAFSSRFVDHQRCQRPQVVAMAAS